MTAYAKLEKHQSYHKRQHDTSAFGFNKKDEMYIYHFLIYYLFIIIIIHLFIFILLLFIYLLFIIIIIYNYLLLFIIYICIMLLHYFNFYSITFKFHPTKVSRLVLPVSVQYHVTNSSKL